MPIKIKIECDKCLNDIDEVKKSSAASFVMEKVFDIFGGELGFNEAGTRILCAECGCEELAELEEKAEREAADDVAYQEYCYRRDRF